jgi:hypothetical protein
VNVGSILVEDGELDAIHQCYKEAAFITEFPDSLNSPLFPVQLSVRHEGKFLAAAVIKLQAHVSLAVCRQATKPGDRFHAVSVLNDELIMRARGLGFDQLIAVLEPKIARRFGRRMVDDWGWQRAVDAPRYMRQI